MAQTKKKRQTKHRGNAAGMVEARGRTSRPPSPEQRKAEAKAKVRAERLVKPPSWRTAIRNSAFVAVALFVIQELTNHKSTVLAKLVIAVIAFFVYAPAGYYLGASCGSVASRVGPRGPSAADGGRGPRSDRRPAAGELLRGAPPGCGSPCPRTTRDASPRPGRDQIPTISREC